MIGPSAQTKHSSREQRQKCTNINNRVIMVVLEIVNKNVTDLAARFEKVNQEATCMTKPIRGPPA